MQRWCSNFSQTHCILKQEKTTFPRWYVEPIDVKFDEHSCNKLEVQDCEACAFPWKYVGVVVRRVLLFCCHVWLLYLNAVNGPIAPKPEPGLPGEGLTYIVTSCHLIICLQPSMLGPESEEKRAEREAPKIKAVKHMSSMSRWDHIWRQWHTSTKAQQSLTVTMVDRADNPLWKHIHIWIIVMYLFLCPHHICDHIRTSWIWLFWRFMYDYLRN